MQLRTCYPQFLLSTCLFFALFSYADEPNTEEVSKINVNGALEYAKSQEDAVIMDVRTPVEFQMSHIPDAVNINVQDESFAAMVSKLDRDKTYIVHCTKNPADGRSAAALVTLQELGFKNLYSMEGGWVAWKDADLPLIETAN